MSKNSSFTQTQLLVLFGLVALIIFIFGVAIMYMFVKKDTPLIVASPTNLIPSPVIFLPTTTLIPTYAYLPTSTSIPSPTSFVLTPFENPNSTPQQAQENPAPANPSSSNSAPDCSATLDYAAAMHQYYLDSIDYIYSPMLNYYQSLIDEATKNRDALGLVQAQRALDDEKAQVKAEKATENKRYKAERDSINANCH